MPYRHNRRLDMGRYQSEKHFQHCLDLDWHDNFGRQCDEVVADDVATELNEDLYHTHVEMLHSQQTPPLQPSLFDFLVIDNDFAPNSAKKASRKGRTGRKSTSCPARTVPEQHLAPDNSESGAIENQWMIDGEDESQADGDVEDPGSMSDETPMVHRSAFGSSKGLLVVNADHCKAAALVPFSTDEAIPIILLSGNSVSTETAFEKQADPLIESELVDGMYTRDTHETMTLMAPTLTALLGQCAASHPSDIAANPNQTDKSRDRGHLLRAAFQKIQQPVGNATTLYDKFMSYLHETSPTTDAAKNEKDGKVLDFNTTCLICLDDLPEDAQFYRLQSCGHGACMDCWTAYVRSIVSSGHSASISCPAHKCSTSIGLFDIPHILFGSHATISEQEAHSMFSTLLANECTDHCIREGRGRYCPSPSCQSTLVPAESQASPAANGWNLMICSCGSTLCVYCPRDAGSHPGIACDPYNKMIKDIDSGKADAEFASYEYMMKRSRPCPKCKSAIERNGGCNHMRCSKCTHYFCWQCGGPGNLCMSYKCNNANKLWFQEPDESSGTEYQDLARKAQTFRNYRSTRDRLQRLDRNIRDLDRDSGDAVQNNGLPQRLKRLVLERQIAQTLLWIRTYLLHSGNKAAAASDASSCQPLQRLELIDHAHMLRSHMTSNSSDNSATTDGSFSLEQVAEVMGIRLDVLCRKKTVVRHKKSMEAKTPLDERFDDLIADQQLQLLCLMTDDKFQHQTLQAVASSIRFLVDKSMPKSKESAARRRPNKDAPKLSDLVDLNKKPGRSRDPWKNGLRVVVDDEDTDAPPLSSSTDSVRWKGKVRVKARRQHALGSW